MINRNQDSSPFMEQVYQEYIEFINGFNISRPISVLMMAMADVVILTDLLLQLAPDNVLVQNLSYLGISPMLFSIDGESHTMGITIDCTVLIMLMSPLITLGTILYHTYWSNCLENGGFKEIFEKSLLDCSIRIYYATFPYLWLPVFISYGAKIMVLGGIEEILGVMIIIWVILSSILIEYHTFELGNDQPDSPNLVPLNFPYHLIDNLLVVTALLCVNLTAQPTSQILGLVFVSIRLALALYAPFFSENNQNYYKLILFSSLIATIGLLVAYYNLDRTFNLLLISALVGYLLLVKNKPEEHPQWEEVGAAEADLEGIQTIKSNLTKKGLFSKSFRALIFLGRQNRSHRGQLEIQILKSKCLGMEKVHRGGARMSGARDVIKFQEGLISFMRNLLRASEQSVSLLKFMQSKEGKKQILAQEVGILVKLLRDNKQIIRQLFQLNEYSHEAKFLLLKTYGQLYSDNAFLKEVQRWMGESIPNETQKDFKETIFNEKSVVVFINILEEIGKVVKISKNLPAVLGYEPTNLLGLSINEIIPMTVKVHHDQNLLDFIDRYSSKTSSRQNKFKFYAYNSEFHLQEVVIRYSWVMNDFNSFYMAGVLEKVESDAHVILTDQFGNLDGWTKKIGGEQFNLDLISIGDRKNYNIMPLFPTLIKYMGSLGVLARTFFFKNAKPRDSNLLVSHGKGSLEELQKKLMEAFQKLVHDQELVGACFGEIEMKKVSLCQGKANMLQITVREFESIENLPEILNLVEKLNTNNNSFKTDKSLVSCNDLGGDSEKQERSIFSEDGKTDKMIDANFSLIPEAENFFSYEQLVFGQFNASKTTFQISAVCQNMNRKLDRTEEAALISPESTFNFTLHKSRSLLWHALLLTLVYLVLFILNLVSVTKAGVLFTAENKNIIARNKAAAIYLKSIFNPNATYIGRFANGSLLEDMAYLYDKQFNYTSFLGDVMPENQYYMFNTQVPATLQRLLNSPLTYSSNMVDITPPTSADYYQQIIFNYQGVVNEYHNKFTDALNEWSSNIQSIRRDFFIRFVFLCIGSLLYGVLLGVTYWRESKHKDTLEAFFKFQKEDLEAKIGAIGGLVRELEGHASELNLLKQFSQIVKREEISNVEFGLIKNPHEVKIKFNHDQDTETAMEQKRYYVASGVVILFLLSQLIFLLIHAVINKNALAFYEATPQDLDRAAKLIVLPNYLLADVYRPLSQTILKEYDAIVNNILGAPLASIPQVYPFLGTVPCVDCQFMYPVLTTNYKSFYSTFQQQAVEMKYAATLNKTKVQDLFYAADYVAENMIPVLLTSAYNYADWSIVLYLFSLAILCAAVHMGSLTIEAEIDQLQLFLHFFGEETIAKNKHISRLFSNFE